MITFMAQVGLVKAIRNSGTVLIMSVGVLKVST